MKTKSKSEADKPSEKSEKEEKPREKGEKAPKKAQKRHGPKKRAEKTGLVPTATSRQRKSDFLPSGFNSERGTRKAEGEKAPTSEDLLDLASSKRSTARNRIFSLCLYWAAHSARRLD